MNRGEFGLNLLGIEGWSTKKYTDAERAKLVAQLAESEPWQTKCTIAMEECAKLIQEISKTMRRGEKGFDIWISHQLGLLEEIADVYICLRYLRHIFHISDALVEDAIDVKLRREAERSKIDERAD